MSFSQEVKEELSKLSNLANKEEVKYEFLGYISSDNTIIENNTIKYTTESDYNIDRFGKVARNIGFEDFEINVNGKIFSIEINESLENSLNKTWSPEQIAGRLRLDYKDDKSMHIGFKIIFRWIYQKVIVRGNLNNLRRKGKSLKTKETRGKFNIGKNIKDRPKEVRKREKIGHWGLDTVVSSRGKSKYCLSTFVERKSRYLHLIEAKNLQVIMKLKRH